METRIDNEECRAYIEVSNPLGWDGDRALSATDARRTSVSNPLGWDGDA